MTKKVKDKNKLKQLKEHKTKALKYGIMAIGGIIGYTALSMFNITLDAETTVTISTVIAYAIKDATKYILQIK